MKLVSVNIENDLHLDRLVPFLKKENPDVVCLQELLYDTAEKLRIELGMRESYYLPLLMYHGKIWGIGILSKYPLENKYSGYYYKPGRDLGVWNEGDFSAENNKRIARGILAVEVTIENVTYRVIDTHFTWSGMAENTPLQKEHMEKLFTLLGKFTDFVICGDLNIPRGSELWSELAKKYKDNIPPEAITTLDRDIHKVGHLDLVVDAMFSTPGYEVKNVRVVSGVSDHMAVVGEVMRRG